jgi:uncharacterized DUF497 family protein
MKQHFDWYAQKAETNRRRHGVTFQQGARATADPFAVEWIDERENYGEESVNLLGMCDGALLHVTYTERGARIWIISARRAERHEQDHYFRENSS